MLNITTWNWGARGIYGNFSYAKVLLKTCDVLAVTEHWLYQDELSFLETLDGNFKCHCSSSSQNDLNYRWKRGQGGVAILWRDRNYFGQKIFTQSDRIIAVKIKSKQNQSLSLLICCVYLPSTNHNFGEFKKVLEDLELFCLKRQSMGETLIILGDFNAHMHDKRSGQKENVRGRMIKDVFDQLQMSVVNIEYECEGPMHTYVSSSGCSVVDYIFLDSTLLQDVKNVKVIDEHPENTAYYLPVKAEIILNANSDDRSSIQRNQVIYSIAWKKYTVNQLAEYSCALTETLKSMQEFNIIKKSDIDMMVDKLTKSMCMLTILSNC